MDRRNISTWDKAFGKGSLSDRDDNLEDGRFSWRIDPVESLSDWTIEILVDGKVHGTYHVHRAILSVGKRKSCYFSRLFLGKVYYVELADRTSKISMEEVAAKHFPVMLDYQYDLGGFNLEITYDNYVPLRYLGDYFDNESLREKLDYFFRDGFDVSRSDICLRHAKLFFDGGAFEQILDQFRGGFFFREDFKSFMVDGDFEIWLELLKKGDADMRKCLSTSLGKFCLKSETDLDAGSFLELTDAALLPELSFESAVSFLRAENMFLPELSSMDYLSSLQTRCVAALVESLHLEREGYLDDNFKEWNPLVVSEIMAAKPGIEKLREDIAISKYPSHIGVYGAGTPGVSGLYYRNAVLSEHFPRYTKRGVCPRTREDVEFVLVSVCEENVGVCWYLSILHGDTKVTDGSDRDFYVSSFAPLRDAMKHFPVVTWHVKENGHSPVPRTVTFSSP